MSFAAVLERLTKLVNPYPGLRPFDTGESHLFFGRDQQVLDLLDRLARNRFVAVLGLSGSGKSSLIRAGLIPALHRGQLLDPGLHWRAVIAKPAGAPFVKLADALSCQTADLRTSSHGLIDYARSSLAKDERLLIVIDQFEELFRYKDRRVASQSAHFGEAADASDAAAFIELLLAAARGSLPVYIVITMRTDYLGDCAEFPGFPEMLNECQYLVPRLTREQRRQAIEGPLGRVRISSALVERILNDAGDEPDQLPILQHVLMRTWSQWRKSTDGPTQAIQLEDYDAVGGFVGALNQHADELLNSDAVRAEPKAVEIIFKRLTALGRGNRERRDPSSLLELWALCNAESDEKRHRVNSVIDVFRSGEATFLTPRASALTPVTYIDITHESLIRNWKILADKWLPDEQRQAKTLVELLERARGWRAGQREVLRGLDLAGALEWSGARNRSTRWAEHYAGTGAIEQVEEFLQASHEEFEASEQQKQQQRHRELAAEQKLREAAEGMAQAERAAARRTRIFSYFLAGLLIAALGLATIAWRATIRARDQQKQAESRGLAAKAEAFVSSGRPGEGLDSAIDAFNSAATSEAREAIAHSLDPALIKFEGHSNYVLNASFSPDGRRVVTARGDRTARVWNVATGQTVAKLEGHSNYVLTAIFSPDGQRVVTASGDRTARVWNAATGQVIAKLEGHSGTVNSAAFSPDGESIVTASSDGTAGVWNARTGQPILKLQGHSGAVIGAAFSPEGRRVVTASSDGTARVWNAATGQVIARLEEHASSVKSAVFSPDGQRVVTASYDKTARVWSAVTGQVIAKLKGHSGIVNTAAFSPDGQRVVTASEDKTARVWDSVTGQVIAKLEGHSDFITTAGFSSDGQRVVTASSDKTARVWNAVTGQVIAKLEGHSDGVNSAIFSPDGQRVVTASGDNTARVWNVAAAGRAIAKLVGHSGPVLGAAFSSDGQRIVTASFDKTARVWNAATGQVIAKLVGHSGPVWNAALSPDGRHVVTASDDKTARVWNAVTGQVTAKLAGHAGSVWSAAFSPDGQRVVTASEDGTARVWNATTGQVIAKLAGHSGGVNRAAFSPDGQRVVTASKDGTARVWNAATGQVIVKLEGHYDGVNSAAFSPDGQRVVTASEDKTARVWDSVTGQVIAKLEGHLNAINNAVFSPDGQRVATASDDRSAQLWNATTGQAIARLEGHSNTVFGAAFSPNGRRVVTASEDKTARVWDTVTGQVIVKLEGHSDAVFGANFSPDGQRIVTVAGGIALIWNIIPLDDIARLLASK